MDTSLRIEYLSQYRLAVCRPIGLLTEERVEQIMEFVVGLEATTPDSFNRLLDLTSITQFPLQSAVIYRCASLRREAVKDLPSCRTAIIAASSDAETVARIYKALMDGSKISVGIFANAILAAEWLGVPEKALEPQLAGNV